MVTAGLSVIAALLGYVGLTYYLNERPEYAGAEPFDRLYYTLQLFILSPTPLGGPPYGAMLSIAMYLAPLTTVLAVLQAISAVFRARFAAWVLLRKRGHSVVVGAGPGAFLLARRLAATRPTVLVGSRIGSDVASRDAVRIVDGDPTDEATLRAAGVRGAARVFALDDSGAVNASVALLVRSLNQAGVAVFARADEGDLVAALRARRLGVDGHNGFRLDFFSIEDVAAAALLDVHDRDLDRTAVVVGSDQFAHAVERDLIRRRRRAGTPVAGRVMRIDDDAAVAQSAATVYVSASDANDVLRRGLRLLLAGNDRDRLDAFDERAGADETERLGSAAIRRAPTLRHATSRGGWASLYDVSPDWQPVIGEIAPGMFVDAGTSGHGFKLAPALGGHIADLIIGAGTDPGLEQFHPRRFERAGALDAGFGEARILG